MTKPSSKTTRHQKPVGAKRHNISLNPECRSRGEKLAALDKRSFSNLLEVLIDKEYERTIAAPKAKELVLAEGSHVARTA